MCFFFNDTATTEIYTYCHTLARHDALPIYLGPVGIARQRAARLLGQPGGAGSRLAEPRRYRRSRHRRADRAGYLGAVARQPHPAHPRTRPRSEEHTSELQSLMRISYAVFCLKKKKKPETNLHNTHKN